MTLDATHRLLRDTELSLDVDLFVFLLIGELLIGDLLKSSANASVQLERRTISAAVAGVETRDFLICSRRKRDPVETPRLLGGRGRSGRDLQRVGFSATARTPFSILSPCSPSLRRLEQRMKEERVRSRLRWRSTESATGGLEHFGAPRAPRAPRCGAQIRTGVRRVEEVGWRSKSRPRRVLSHPHSGEVRAAVLRAATECEPL